MKVELGETKTAPKENQVIEVVVFVESIRSICEFSFTIVRFKKLIDKIEGRHRSKEKEC